MFFSRRIDHKKEGGFVQINVVADLLPYDGGHAIPPEVGINYYTYHSAGHARSGNVTPHREIRPALGIAGRDYHERPTFMVNAVRRYNFYREFRL